MTFADESIDPREKYNLNNFHKIIKNASIADISPDGKEILYISWKEIKEYNTSKSLWIADINGSNQRMIYTGKLFTDTFPKFSPDGNQILIGVRTSIVFLTKNGTRWDTNCSKINLTCKNDIGLLGFGYDFSWTPDGEKILFVYNDDNSDMENYRGIAIVDKDGKNYKPLVKSSRLHGMPSMSPDSKKIAYLSTEPVEDFSRGSSRIWIMNADGSNQKCITKYQSNHRDPVFNSKGKIIFSSSRASPINYDGSAGNIWMMNADGSNQILIVPDVSGLKVDGASISYNRRPSVSQDGTIIIFDSWHTIFYVKDLDGDGIWEDSDGDGVADVCDGAPNDPNAGYVGALNRHNESKMKNTYLGVLIATTIIVIGFVLLKIKYMDKKKKSRFENPKIKDEKREWEVKK